MEDSQKYFFKDYNQIRPLLRSIFLYGCFNEEHYTKGSSLSTLNNRLQYIDIALPNGFIEKGDTIKCHFKPNEWQDDIILNTYRFNSIKKEDLIKVYILAMMYIDEEGISLREFLDICNDSDFDLDIKIQTLRDYLNEMVDSGLLVKDNSEKTDRYMMQKAYLSGLSIDTLENLYLLLDFLSKCSEFQAPYYLAKKKIALVLEARHYQNSKRVKDANPIPKLNFNFHHAFLVNSLDNDVMYKFLLMIEKHHRCEIKIDEFYYKRIPLRIIHDAWSGKQYLLSYNEDEKRIEHIELSDIEDVYKLEEISSEDWNKYLLKAEEKIKSSWTASDLDTELEEVEIEFYEDANSKRDNIIRTRIIREFGEDFLIEDDEKYTVKLRVNDPLELAPLIKSFGNFARVIKPQVLVEEMKKTWENCSKQIYRKDIKGENKLYKTSTHYTEGTGEKIVSIFDKYENCVLELLTRLNIWSYYNESLLDPYEKDGQLKGDLDKIKRYSLVNHFNGDYHSRIKSNDKVFKFCFDNNFFNIFDIDDDDDEVIFNNPLGEKRLMRVALTNIEKEAIVNALKDKRAPLFLSQIDIDKINNCFNDVNSSWKHDDIIVKHKLHNNDIVYADIHDTYKVLSRAIAQKKSVTYNYRTHDGRFIKINEVYPVEFNYSVKEGVLRIYVYDDSSYNKFKQNNLERIADISLIKDAKKLELKNDYKQNSYRNSEYVEVFVVPNEVELERIMRLFSYLRKDVSIKGEEIEMRLYFASSMRNTIINNLLSCGDAVRVKYKENKFSKQIIDKAKEALELYK